jgi:hypothetical protein
VQKVNDRIPLVVLAIPWRKQDGVFTLFLEARTWERIEFDARATGEFDGTTIGPSALSAGVLREELRNGNQRGSRRVRKQGCPHNN